MEDRDGFDKNECLFGGGGGLLVDGLFLWKFIYSKESDLSVKFYKIP